MIHTAGIREVILGILIIMALSQVIHEKAILFFIIAGIYYATDYKTINQSLHGLWKGVTKENEETRKRNQLEPIFKSYAKKACAFAMKAIEERFDLYISNNNNNK